MTLRQVAVLLATAFAVLTPASQAIWDLGLSASEFSRSGDTTLRAAGYAFSIWSLIYIGLVAYAVWHALPRNREAPRLARLGWPSAVAIVGCGLWLWASAADARWLTVTIIFTSAAVLIQGLLAARGIGEATWRETVLVSWPLGLLGGWLTIASAINLLTVLTAEGLIPPSDSGSWGAAGIVAVLLIALAVTVASRLAIYAMPVVWGFIAVAVAEHPDTPVLAVLAVGAAGALAATALWRAWRNRLAHRPSARAAA